MLKTGRCLGSHRFGHFLDLNFDIVSDFGFRILLIGFMSQNLKVAKTESAYVLDLIARKKLSPKERKRVIKESVQYWKDHVNAGFLQYRKSVSTDYTAVEWEDEGACFRDINGKEFLDMLGGFGIYVTGH